MIKAIKGFNDILPDQSAKWLYLESILANVLGRYGYEHIRLPIVEQTDLFARAIGGAQISSKKRCIALSISLIHQRH